MPLQAFPSEHDRLTLVSCLHEPATHASAVHGLLSLQFFGVPLQTPPEHTSEVVQRLPSSHVLVLLAW